MDFSCLTKIVRTEQDLDLRPTNSDWKLVDSIISVSHGWLTENEFNLCFSPYIGEKVFAFETFERVNKASGISNRLEQSFVLNWMNFKEFQETTTILFVYVVPVELNWVFYANRDKWQFAVQP
ncbi:hypothetical protein [Rheinheimera texasensis]|uniref:hypothetical protein n=1 Tax=Rheinheimera texasensis TaxID=306205 RepID=UPI0032B1297C